MFNPFDLTGPEFLFFYAVLGVVIVFLLFQLSIQYKEESVDWSIWGSMDPYMIAYLRLDFDESLRVVLISLIERGFLKSVDGKIVSEKSAKQYSLKPIERDVVEYFQKPKDVAGVYADQELKKIESEYHKKMTKIGLIYEDQALFRRKLIWTSAFFVLAGISAVKMIVALQRGHGNIIFLIILTIIFISLVRASRPLRRTPSGDATMLRIKSKYKNLKHNSHIIKLDVKTDEVEYLAGVFGIASLSVSSFPYVKELFPHAYVGSAGSTGGAGCGGGGCGGGGGGGGGGGCGGGCGGCGG